jgi:hypothetical protein
MRQNTLLLAGLMALSTTLFAQQPKDPAPTLRSTLLKQFQSTWNKENWFVPISVAVDGITAQQAMWKPCDSCHSVGQLAYHLLFWNRQSLDKFYDRKPASFNGDNNETFTAFTEASWAATVKELNQVMQDWQTAIEQADEAKLRAWYPTIANINTHNAYHTGQIIYIRKLAGNWDASKGVK